MRQRYALILSILIFLIIASLQYSFAKTTKEPLYIDLSKTMGFIMGQRFSLNRIKVEYPSLSRRVQKVDYEFKSVFGIAVKNIETALRDLLKDKYPEYVTTMEKQFKSTLLSQSITQDNATQFLNEVESRADGKLPSPILETLLIYQFEESPVQELVRGFKAKYTTNGHRKAKGLDLQIEYAKSWSLREGNRPNVIQFFSSNNGRGPASALIMTRDLLEEAQGEFTSDEIKYLKTLEGSKELASVVFSDSGLREMATGMGITNVRNIKTKRIVLDRWPGAMLEFVGDQQRLDFTLTMYNRMYVAIYKNYMIFLHCQVTKLPNDTNDALKTRIGKFAPLFHLMANSLVIQNQY